MSQEAIELLKSIDASLRALVKQGAVAHKEIADDRDLDGQYGNPQVKFNPRDWTGPSMTGREMSECPADFLEMLAGTFDYFAMKAEEADEKTTAGKPVAPYKRKDAARARGWAKRIRDGKHTPAPVGGAAGDTWNANDGGWT